MTPLEKKWLTLRDIYDIMNKSFGALHCVLNDGKPACRNGRRGRLKICCGQPRAGSSPAAGIRYDFKVLRVILGTFFYM